MLKFLEAERVYLRPLQPSDAQGPYPHWLNDAAVCHGNSHHRFPYSEQKAQAYIQAISSTESALVLGIVLKEGDVHIGNIALQEIHPINRTAEFAILLGDKTQWGRGIALEAGQLVVRHGFSSLNLHRIYCATFDTNEGMKKLALALGMKQEGVRRQAAFKEGAYLDIVEYGLLKTDWAS